MKAASEPQIFRVDHFLGKEPVQGILPLRFNNGIFEPMWSREFIDSVQITAAETLGVEHRGKFYEPTGALRDMVPNHLLSLLTMTAMEAPSSFEAEAVRDAKVALLQAIRPIAPGDAARGQYAAGTMDGKAVLAYRDEDNVARDSRTETFMRHWPCRSTTIAGTAYRSTYAVARHLTTIAVLFKGRQRIHVRHRCPISGFSATFQAKKPGPALETGEARTSFNYKDFFEEPPAVSYETLLAIRN